MFPIPASTKTGFAYSGDFYAETSGGKWHPCASVKDIAAHFKSGSEKDQPDHWFEAQLRHYGLQHSEIRSVARMSLFDAILFGKLEVPQHIERIRESLKYEWLANRWAARRVAEAIGKAELNPSPRSPNRAASTTPSPSVATSATLTEEPIASRDGDSPASSRRSSSVDCDESPRSRSRSPLRPSMTQRSDPSGTRRSRGSTPIRLDDSNDDARKSPRPHPETYRFSSALRNLEKMKALINEKPNGYRRELMATLNGQFDIMSTKAHDTCGHAAFHLVLALTGSELWGTFDFGVVKGVMFFTHGPWMFSYSDMPFVWRGMDRDGAIVSGYTGSSKMRLHCDGRIEGEIDYMGLRFSGVRRRDQGTYSSIDGHDSVFSASLPLKLVVRVPLLLRFFW
ncbi:hypothetical protein GGS24DRAFT_457308 [Hypoxylon argillaceum]|nr:hypothetical protein GGS24DRAFT_457308 [Hypoxylon argillaceum]